MLPENFQNSSDEDIAEMLVNCIVNDNKDKYNLLFDLIWNRFHKRFRAYIRTNYYKASQGDIDDILQEVFSNIKGLLLKYNPSKSSLKTYLYKILYFKTIDYIKDHQTYITDLPSGEDIYSPDLSQPFNDIYAINFVLELHTEPTRIKSEYLEPRIIYFCYNTFLDINGLYFISEGFSEQTLIILLGYLIKKYCSLYGIERTDVKYEEFVNSLLKKSIEHRPLRFFIEGNPSVCLTRWQEQIKRTLKTRIRDMY